MSGWRFLFFFRMILVVLLAVVQLFFYTSIRRYLSESRRPSHWKTLLNILFISFNVPTVVPLFWRPDVITLPPWEMNFAVYPFYVWHYSFLFLFLLLAAGKIVQFPVLLAARIRRLALRKKQKEHTNLSTSSFDSQRRHFVRQGLTVLAGASFATSTFGIIRRDRYEVTNIAVPVPHLPEQMKGFTIALASDIHSSVFMTKERMREYADAINSLGTDLIAVTGDFVNSLVEEVYPFAEAFSELKAPNGVFGVLGNHDYFSRDVEVVAREINQCGIRLLRNERIPIVRNGDSFDLLGIDDVGNGLRASTLIDKSLTAAGENTPRILLCHRPYFFPLAANRSIALTLSGHTHGGQIVLVKLGNEVIAPARMVSPYVAGLYSIGQSHMYVSRGIGTVGVPIRLNCPPELTKITLVPS